MLLIYPETTFIILNVTSQYDKNDTTLSPNPDLQTNKILNTLTDYTEGDLGTFDRPFRHSKVLSLIDNTDKSILNSTDPQLQWVNFSPH